MKEVRIFWMLFLISVGVVFSTACSKEDNKVYSDLDLNDNLKMELVGEFVTTDNLSADELAMLLYMKEEEKLARDVYLTLKEKWGSKVFENIASAEQKHVDAIVAILNYYEIDKLDVLNVGVYENESFDVLFNDLVSQGEISELEAIKVGALIEELDIVDLRERINSTENENIIRVFTNLILASENHLRVFNRQLLRNNVAYEPQYLTVEEFAFIISQNEKGNKKGKKNIKGKCK